MIIFSDKKEQNARDVAEVFRNSGIIRPYEEVERIQRMIDNTDIIITAWDDDKMVGVARAITDYSYSCYLSDLAVDQRYQNHGIGKELVQRVHTKIGDECSLILLAAPTAVDYYPKLGFEKADKAFLMTRKK
ncbi:GNAT family N-acetyltransferase [Paenibacillus sp. D2_2]|uniref:GNAT family N-acetyltransferase n=1 Tax=Paenibacillus sp. D2_2 TaxID=3073092 RepID=UPI002815EC8C|nr:GNAT family N-acetyltransferase [Paenibacillus sp. D2_2]WMT39597.1 GNAT family N-acetyltransferase [Paenibacillus sp. D2_2]